MEFVLIRHTACDVAPGICYGRLDVSLCASADEDIALTLGNVPAVAAVFSSPSIRCAMLAERLARRERCELTMLDELRELDFGAWEGRPWDRIPRAESDHWAEDPWNRAPPNGETEAALFARVTSAYRTIARCTASRVAIVAHGGPLRLLRCAILARPLAERWDWSIARGEVELVKSNTWGERESDGVTR